MDNPEAESSYPNKELQSIFQFLNQASFQTGDLRKDAVTLQQVYSCDPFNFFLKEI